MKYNISSITVSGCGAVTMRQTYGFSHRAEKGINPFIGLLFSLGATIKISGCGAVDSAPGLGPGGRRFESFHPDHERFSEFLDRSTIKLYGGFSFITEIALSPARRFATTSLAIASIFTRSSVLSSSHRCDCVSSKNSSLVGSNVFSCVSLALLSSISVLAFSINCLLRRTQSVLLQLKLIIYLPLFLPR